MLIGSPVFTTPREKALLRQQKGICAIITGKIRIEGRRERASFTRLGSEGKTTTSFTTNDQDPIIVIIRYNQSINLQSTTQASSSSRKRHLCHTQITTNKQATQRQSVMKLTSSGNVFAVVAAVIASTMMDEGVSAFQSHSAFVRGSGRSSVVMSPASTHTSSLVRAPSRPCGALRL